MQALTWHQVRVRRLKRSHLLEPAPREHVAAVVSDVCGVQAQVMAAAELAIGVRVEGLTQQGVREQLWERRTLVKTYGPRGTQHVLPATELPMWMAALRAISDRHTVLWHELADVSRQQMDELAAATREVLDGQTMSRDELSEALRGHAGAWADERLSSTWGDLLAPAALFGALCFGPPRGTKVTFVRADQWIEGWEEKDPNQSLLEVARRFLKAYGPSTAQEFARWFSMKPADARELFDQLAEDVEAVDVEGTNAVALIGDLDEPFEEDRDIVRLVPQYDAFVLGSRPKEQLVADPVTDRIRAHKKGRYEGAAGVPTMLVDGRVTALWERRKSGGRVDVVVEPVEPLTSRQHKRLHTEAQRVANFFGGSEASLSVRVLE